MNGILQIAGNNLMLLQSGSAYFPQLCADIDAAHHSIYLETYIFAADETGHMVSAALRRAAARGVTVRLMLDGFGSAELPQRWVDDLRSAGVEVQWFRRKISPLTLRRSRLRRLHRKLVVIDGEIAFVGGINITDDIPQRRGLAAPRLDYAVRLKGALTGEIHAVMRHLWGMVSWANVHHHSRRIHWRLREAKRPQAAGDVALVLRDNLRHRRDIERAYLKAIATAQHEIIIANAYFLPGRVFRRALKLAVQRGVRVVLLLQGKVEYRLQHYATHALYEELLGAGIEIYEYLPSYLHAKVAVVDGQWATVGSSNIDPFSLLLAREANLVVRDAAFAGEVRKSLMAALASEARRVEFARESVFVHVLARMSYGIVRFLVGMLGMSRRQ
ncbi:cardiolipin synthase B [Ferrigenium kumadai]|uniref:Cardiolipin synthase B n=1 Tax=Ferrigenium kumadai TaxID=1682490 RepID=A0AAN1SXR1_9PROT|nr:cardiolipin synthase ClsB [Ferrigenium kumadai]BBI98858.1 cardiolipin synthase B [Ferrigenium kumadai]